MSRSRNSTSTGGASGLASSRANCSELFPERNRDLGAGLLDEGLDDVVPDRIVQTPPRSRRSAPRGSRVHGQGKTEHRGEPQEIQVAKDVIGLLPMDVERGAKAPTRSRSRRPYLPTGGLDTTRHPVLPRNGRAMMARPDREFKARPDLAALLPSVPARLLPGTASPGRMASDCLPAMTA